MLHIGLHIDLYCSLLHLTGRRCELHRNCCRLVSDLAGNCCLVAVALNRENLIIVRVPLVGARGVIRHRRCHKLQGLELCHFSLVGFAVLGFQLNAGGCHGSVYSDLPGVGVLPTNETFVGVRNNGFTSAYTCYSCLARVLVGYRGNARILG